MQTACSWVKGDKWDNLWFDIFGRICTLCQGLRAAPYESSPWCLSGENQSLGTQKASEGRSCSWMKVWYLSPLSPFRSSFFPQVEAGFSMWKVGFYSRIGGWSSMVINPVREVVIAIFSGISNDGVTTISSIWIPRNLTKASSTRREGSRLPLTAWSAWLCFWRRGEVGWVGNIHLGHSFERQTTYMSIFEVLVR